MKDIWEAAFDNDIEALERCLEKSSSSLNGKWNKDFAVLSRTGAWLLNGFTFFLAGLSKNVRYYMFEFDKDGLTPLHFAAWGSSIEVAKILIDKGADTSDKENYLQWASESFKVAHKMAEEAYNQKQLLRASEERNADLQEEISQLAEYSEIVKQEQEDLKKQLKKLEENSNNSYAKQLKDLEALQEQLKLLEKEREKDSQQAEKIREKLKNISKIIIAIRSHLSNVQYKEQSDEKVTMVLPEKDVAACQELNFLPPFLSDQLTGDYCSASNANDEKSGGDGSSPTLPSSGKKGGGPGPSTMPTFSGSVSGQPSVPLPIYAADQHVNSTTPQQALEKENDTATLFPLSSKSASSSSGKKPDHGDSDASGASCANSFSTNRNTTFSQSSTGQATNDSINTGNSNGVTVEDATDEDDGEQPSYGS